MKDTKKQQDENIEFRTLFVMIDGMGDNGIKELGMKTPLQYGEFNNFNALAQGGLMGLHDPVQSGLACGSDTAHMSIFGYDPFIYYNGRGAYETMGSGIPMDFNDIAFKANFSYMNDETGIVERRRVDRYFDKWGLDLCPDLSKIEIPGYPGYKVTVLHSTEHRCGVKVSGPNLSSEITGTDPIVDDKPLRKAEAIDKNNKNAVMTADLVNNLSEAIRKRLREHSITKKRKEEGKVYTNVIVLRGCASRLKCEPIQEKSGIHGFLVAPTAVIAGIGMTFGIEAKPAKGATGYYDSDFMSKATVALQHITSGQYNFGFLHIKGVDDSGHDGNYKMKLELFKRINEMIGRLIKELHESEEKSSHKVKYVMVMTGDHTTPVGGKEHSYDPVPVVVTSVGSAYLAQQGIDPQKASNKIDQILCMMRDGVLKYNELEACKGSLGRFQGLEMMQTIKRFQDACRKCINDNINSK